MHQVIAALGTAIAGLTASIVGAVAETPASDFGPWAQVGGTATAVAALAYVAKLLADGRLVAQPTAELLKASADREDRLVALEKRSEDREATLRTLLLRGQGAGE